MRMQPFEVTSELDAERTVEKTAQAQGVNEQFKTDDQMARIGGDSVFSVVSF